jgi:hypothetical protein
MPIAPPPVLPLLLSPAAITPPALPCPSLLRLVGKAGRKADAGLEEDAGKKKPDPELETEFTPIAEFGALEVTAEFALIAQFELGVGFCPLAPSGFPMFDPNMKF